jgi:hypothetical protein
MTFVDALIPLVVGLLLVALPQAFTKPTGSREEIVARYARLRRIGYGLLAVAVLLFVLVLLRRPR